MEPSCEVEEVFERIARLVPRAPVDATGCVTHDAMVAAVLADPA